MKIIWLRISAEHSKFHNRQRKWFRENPYLVYCLKRPGSLSWLVPVKVRTCLRQKIQKRKISLHYKN